MKFAEAFLVKLQHLGESGPWTLASPIKISY